MLCWLVWPSGSYGGLGRRLAIITDSGAQRRLARQLGRPSGLTGLRIARRLNTNNAAMVADAVAACAVSPGDRVADIGFGGGSGLSLLLQHVLPGGHVDGVDLSATMVRRARRVCRRAVRAGQLTVHQGSITDLPLGDAALDAVMTVNTVYFVPDLPAATAELARTLRPGGRVVVCVEDSAKLGESPFTAHGFLLRPVDDLVQALVDAGLRRVQRSRVADKQRPFDVLIATVG